MFCHPWIILPKAVYLLNRCEIVLVHNRSVREEAISLGIEPNHLYILDCYPSHTKVVFTQAMKARYNFPRPWILFPCSFDSDEPINVVFDVALLIPEATFIVTGDKSRAKGIHDLSKIPENAKLVNFIPVHDYNAILSGADIVLCLTTREGVQLSVANEALGAGKPLVISDTLILKELYYKGAIYVNTIDSCSISHGCKEALQNKNELSNEVIEMKAEYESRWLNQASEIRILLENKKH